MGTGPIFLPPVVLQAGIGFAIIFIVIIVLICYLTAECVIEGLSLANALEKKRKLNVYS